MRQRLINVTKKFFVLFLIGILYLIWCRVTGIHIPCLFRMKTGLYCPGCGVTDMFVALSKLEFIEAFNFNPVIFTLSPIWCVMIFFVVRRYILSGEFKINNLESIIIWLSIACLIIFSLIRNIGNYHNFLYKTCNCGKYFAILPNFVFHIF